MGESISFIHLSDIHFRKFSGDNFDIDQDLRNEIIRDISKNAKNCLENIKGILVCGDIAFSGQESEYQKAEDFLKEICNILSISETAVYCVPGNHDVNQSVSCKGSVIYSIQSELEKTNTSVEIDAKLAGYNRDKSSNDILFKHMETYNIKFAGKFGCNINCEKPNWQVDFPLNYKNTLRVYGLNSIIISNQEDHKDKFNDKLMILGKHQVPKREDGIIYMSLCHHPPECWKDPNDDVQKLINKRVHIQLYGHKHIQEVKQINDDSLIIGSGATHPSRFENGWSPRYNWINIEVVKKNGQSYLNTKIYQRVLSPQEDKFIADIDSDCSYEYKEYLMKLEDECVTGSSDKLTVINTESINNNYTIKEKEISVKQIDVDTKTIVYRFVELPFIIQTSILSKCGLIQEDYQGKKYIDIIDEIIEKARQLGHLDELWKEIRKY